MRTTLDLDPYVVSAARAVARVTGQSLGQVISELVRRGLAPPVTIVDDELFPMFAVATNVAPITDEMVRTALHKN